jgi:neurotrimin
MMWVPYQQSRAIRGGSATLACFVESHPEALTFWHHGGRIIQPRGKFSMSTKQGQPSYKVEMRLTVDDLGEDDFGNYTCIAKNPRGNVTGVINLTGGKS